MAVVKDYQQLWKGVADATDKAEAVRVLAEIVADFDGRTFALGLGPEAVKLCVETLDYVGCFLNLHPFVASTGLVRASLSATSKPPRGMLSPPR